MSEVVSEQQLAAKAAHLAKNNDYRVIYLQGDLGTGKTTFCKHFINYLVPDALVTSPTYPIIQEYLTSDQPKFILYHIDLYRMSHPHQVEELGLQELVSNHSVLLIEWPDKGAVFTPRADFIVALDYMDYEHRLYSAGVVSADGL